MFVAAFNLLESPFRCQLFFFESKDFPILRFEGGQMPLFFALHMGTEEELLFEPRLFGFLVSKEKGFEKKQQPHT